jgi:hypothetical protein
MRDVDPFAGVHAEDNGVAELRAAAVELAGGEATMAAAHVARARRKGVPTEAVPHALALHGAALTAAGEPHDAIALLKDGWRDHPDAAVLPAFLGVAQFAVGRKADAARTFYAALLCDDPDATLPAWRSTLTALRRTIGMA